MPTPSWAPTREHVADYVTSRTVDTDTPGDDAPTGTFFEHTYPTGDQVDRLIASATAWVLNVTGPVVTDLEGTARDAAALRAAALVEMSYPERDADVEVANVLLEQALAARTELAAANRAAGGVGVGTAATPLGCFPDAAIWTGDQPGWTGR